MFKSLKRIKAALNPDLSRSDLLSVLRGLNPENMIDERINSLKGLMEWMRLPTKTVANSPIPPHLQVRNIRFKFMIQFLERNPIEEKYFIETLREILGRGVAIRLYCQTGVADNSGFISELSERMIQRFLPQVVGERDLAEVFKAVFTEVEDAEWVEKCHDLILPPLMETIRKNDISTEGIINDQVEALIILGAQIASLGMSRGIRRRLTDSKLSNSHFIKLNTVINREKVEHDLILQEVSLCRLDIQKVRQNIESAGVSVALIYNLEKISSLLDRVEMLIYLRNNRGQNKEIIISHFIGRLIRDEIKSLGVRDYLAQHLQMLTKKIVERAGEKGDHYIASTSEDRRELFIAASWAGVLTSFTAVIKFGIGAAPLPLFFEGFFYFINYALGFLMMQKWHLALSSKQPAFTASALSNKFEDFLKTKELFEIISEVKKISYSQLIASVGNLLYVVPITILLDSLYFYSFGSHIVSDQAAMDIIRKHHPLQSATLLFAAFTGVLLWLSSVVAGWVENWVVFRHIPEIMGGSTFLNTYFGKEKTKAIAARFPAIIGAAAGNISIAFFLAAPIIIGKLTGIPLDIRHVTLATGTITLAFNSLGWDYELWPLMIAMITSIFMMGLLNFGVSFYFAIRMAAIARGVENRYLKIIFRFSFWRRRSTVKAKISPGSGHEQAGSGQ